VLAASLNNLGSVWRAEGRKKGSEDSIRQAVATWERLLVRIILTLRRV